MSRFRRGSFPTGRWLALLLWTLVIFLLVPVANDLRRWLVDRLGAQALFWTMVGVLGAAFLAAVYRLRSRTRSDRPALDSARRPIEQTVWLLGIAVVVAAWGWTFRLQAEPAHFVSYAVLAVLAFRAFQPWLRDRGVYLAAAALTAVVGILDEILQWLHPDRVWDLHDVALDAGIGALVQLLIWKGLRPPGVLPGFSPQSLRVGVRLLAAGVLLLLLCVSNTPARTAWLADRVPGLAYLGHDAKTRMSDYGYRFVDPAIGRFASRLSPRELARADSERGTEAAEILTRYRRPDRHAELKRLYPPWRDPFVHELREHLSVRGRYRALALRAGQDPEVARRSAAVSYRENLILERYFARALEEFGAELEPQIRRRLEVMQPPGGEFTSVVARDLVTSYSEAQAQVALVTLLVFLVIADRSCGRPDRR